MRKKYTIGGCKATVLYVGHQCPTGGKEDDANAQLALKY